MIKFFLGGDFRFFWTENIGNFAHLPLAWDSSLNTGIGQSQIGSLWINSYLNFTAMFSNLGLSWNLIGLIFWILPAIILSFFSSFYLFNYLFKDKIKYSLLAGFIYVFNTYFLMILTGGQVGVALSYSLVPLVLLTFIRITKNPTLKNALLSGLILGLQILFDPRIVYVTLIAVSLYLLFNLAELKIIKNKLLLLVPFVVAVLLNSFWILPLVLTKSSGLPAGFDNVSSFKFFSFADFSHALSLLHPNWPENIFGKIYFLNPQFLVLPIIAFLSLLFYKTRIILFFCLLALTGAFLAKGANPPFGELNQWLFQNFPGMVMFRDPTKFYILVALSYSMLIPYSIFQITFFVKSKIIHSASSGQNLKLQFKIQKYLPNTLLLIVFFYLLFLTRPIWIDSTFKPKEVPLEYVILKDFINTEPKFFRILWIPQWQRFGFFSNNHPAIGRGEVFEGDAKSQLKQLQGKGAQELLSNFSVKYIIIPLDSEGEIFLKDRKYNEEERKRIEKELDKISWLNKLNNLNDLNHFSNKIAVYEINNPKNHFWSPSTTLGINYQYVNATEYKVQVKNAKSGDLLVFSEGFDKNWTAYNSEFRIQSSRMQLPEQSDSGQKKLDVSLNSFELPDRGNYELKVVYGPQKYVEAGLWLSAATLLASLGYLVFGKFRKK